MDGISSEPGPEYDDRPRVFVIADGDAAEADARQACEAAGGRIAASLPLTAALDQLDQLILPDAIMVECREVASPPVDRLLDRLGALAADGRLSVVASVPMEMVDRAVAALNGEGTTILCRPDPVERAAALSLALGPRQLLVADMTRESESARLQRLADEVSRIARALANLSATAPAPPPVTGMSDVMIGFRAEPSAVAAEVEGGIDPSEIRSIIRRRRLRDQFFDALLFADPAWDMLLDLMAARLERVQVAVSSLCIAAAVPPTTALRWIATMTEHGLFERVADPDDGRRIFIRLSDKAAQGMMRYFEAAGRTASRTS